MATSEIPSSGPRRRRVRVAADMRVVIAFCDGQKVPARVIDVSAGGMHLTSERTPEYGELVTVVVRLRETDDWSVLPAAVRWFSRGGFGVAFEQLDATQAHALARFVDHAAA